MTALIDQAAKALYTFDHQYHAPDGEPDWVTWEELDEAGQDEYRAAVGIVLRALRPLPEDIATIVGDAINAAPQTACEAAREVIDVFIATVIWERYPEGAASDARLAPTIDSGEAIETHSGSTPKGPERDGEAGAPRE